MQKLRQNLIDDIQLLEDTVRWKERQVEGVRERAFRPEYKKEAVKLLHMAASALEEARAYLKD